MIIRCKTCFSWERIFRQGRQSIGNNQKCFSQKHQRNCDNSLGTWVSQQIFFPARALVCRNQPLILPLLLFPLRSCLYEKNHLSQVRRLTWVRFRQNGVFCFVKTNCLHENAVIPPRWNLTTTQVKSHLGEMIFLYVNSFCWAVPPRQDCSFSLDSLCL